MKGYSVRGLRRKYTTYCFLFSIFLLLPCLLFSDPSIRVVRPYPGENLGSPVGFTFVIGMVSPTNATVQCNGVPCDVSSDGAFIGFAPIRIAKEPVLVEDKICDAHFEFFVQSEGKAIKELVTAISPKSPSATTNAYELFDTPKTVQLLKDYFYGLEGPRLGDIVFIPKGAKLLADSGSPKSYACRTEDGLEISITITECEIRNEKRTDSDRVLEISVPNQQTIIASSADSQSMSFTNRVVWGAFAQYSKKSFSLQPRYHLRSDKKPISSENPFLNLRICIDPGHHPDPGAVGPRGFEERDSALLISRETAALLEKEGAHVSFTREEKGADLRERHAIMHRLKPDLVISIHNNSVGDGIDPRQKHGTQTFYLYPWSKSLAESIHQSLIQQLGTTDMGCIRRNLYVTRFPECPSVLLEPEYLILPDQEKKFLDPEYRKLVASGIVNGVRKFLEQAQSTEKNDHDKVQPAQPPPQKR